MPTPITPQFLADTVILEDIRITYKPAWDGANWVITPADIEVTGRYALAEGEPQLFTKTLTIPFNDIPGGGQTALQDLYTFIEAEIAALYP